MTLALETAPMVWPIGKGRDFRGTFDLRTPRIRELDGTDEGRPVTGPDDPPIAALLEPDEATRRTLLAHARTQLGAAVAPKSIEFASVLPHTRSDKIMRRLLKARALGLPEGDTSTLESGPDTA